MLIVWDSSFIVWMCLAWVVFSEHVSVLGKEGKVDWVWVASNESAESGVSGKKCVLLDKVSETGRLF